MFKGARKDRTAHTKQKPKPRFVSKAHRLEQNEQQSALALDAAPRPSERPKNKTTVRR
jgi:hypothetical protein